jgi:hypothetical protein
MGNVKFSYLYRDAGNYKKWGHVVFSNPDKLTKQYITKALERCFLQKSLFVAAQICLPDCFLFLNGNANSDDHCFHEFDAVEITTKCPDDSHSRSILELLADVERESTRGWIATDVHATTLNARD